MANVITKAVLLARAEALRARIHSMEKMETGVNELQQYVTTHGYTREQVYAVARQMPSSEPDRDTFYRHPKHAGLTWSGFGRQPTWLKELLATGMTLEELLVLRPAPNGGK